MLRLALACLSMAGSIVLTGTAPAQPQNNPSFNLVNRAQQPINEMYATPKGMDNWGKEMLRDTTVAPGASFAVRLPVGQCTYDLRVVYGNGRVEEKRSLDTCTLSGVAFDGSGAAAAARQDGAGRLSFSITNLSTATISSVLATPAGVHSWGKDRLGDQDTIEHDATRTISLPNDGKCIYDIRLVYSDDSTFEKRKVDLCHDPVRLWVN